MKLSYLLMFAALIMAVLTVSRPGYAVFDGLTLLTVVLVAVALVVGAFEAGGSRG